VSAASSITDAEAHWFKSAGSRRNKMSSVEPKQIGTASMRIEAPRDDIVALAFQGGGAQRALAVAIIIMVAFNGLLLSANGIFMLIAPAVWYELVPGVTDTGFFNQHFIRDIGIIQLFLGVAFGLGMIRPEWRIGLWGAATLWLSAHAIFHLWEVAVGICAPSAILRDFPGVSLPAIIGMVLTLWAIHHAQAGRAASA
jgi:uncharacterized protein YjeT (DUF2065 family)